MRSRASPMVHRRYLFNEAIHISRAVNRKGRNQLPRRNVTRPVDALMPEPFRQRRPAHEPDVADATNALAFSSHLPNSPAP